MGTGSGKRLRCCCREWNNALPCASLDQVLVVVRVKLLVVRVKLSKGPKMRLSKLVRHRHWPMEKVPLGAAKCDC